MAKISLGGLAFNGASRPEKRPSGGPWRQAKEVAVSAAARNIENEGCKSRAASHAVNIGHLTRKEIRAAVSLGMRGMICKRAEPPMK